MDWKLFTQDLVLYQDLMKRFVELGCTEEKAFELAAYLYISQDSSVVIRTKVLNSSDEFNRLKQ
jgi:hypothetical protein